MFISIIRELLTTKVVECNEICKTLFNDEYEGSNTASQEELRSFPGNINLNYSRYIHLSATKETVYIIIKDTIKI